MEQKRDGFIKCNFVLERMDFAEPSLMSVKCIGGFFFLVVRSTHAETFPSFLGAKPLKISLGWEDRDLACVRGPRKTARGRATCRLYPQST